MTCPNLQNHRRPVPQDNDCPDCQIYAEKVRQFFYALDLPLHTMTGGPSSNVKIQGLLLYEKLMDPEQRKLLIFKLNNPSLL